MTAILPSVPVLDEEDEDTTDPWCVCPDGMPCYCVADSADPIYWGD